MHDRHTWPWRLEGSWCKACQDKFRVTKKAIVIDTSSSKCDHSGGMQVRNNSVSGQAAGLVLVSSGDSPYPYSDHSNISFINNLVVGVQTTPMAVTSGSNINITGAFLLPSVTSLSNMC